MYLANHVVQYCLGSSVGEQWKRSQLHPTNAAERRPDNHKLRIAGFLQEWKDALEQHKRAHSVNGYVLLHFGDLRGRHRPKVLGDACICNDHVQFTNFVIGLQGLYCLGSVAL